MLPNFLLLQCWQRSEFNRREKYKTKQTQIYAIDFKNNYTNKHCAYQNIGKKRVNAEPHKSILKFWNWSEFDKRQKLQNATSMTLTSTTNIQTNILRTKTKATQGCVLPNKSLLQFWHRSAFDTRENVQNKTKNKSMPWTSITSIQTHISHTKAKATQW